MGKDDSLAENCFFAAGLGFDSETGCPIVERANGDFECDGGGFSSSALAGKDVTIGEGGHQGSGATNAVTVVEVVDGGVVEVDSLFDETEAEDADVEVYVLLGVARDCGDVVNS